MTTPISAASAWAGNYVDRYSDPIDDHGHGTHVAGLAAAMADNAIGVAGVDWPARLLPEGAGSSGSGYDSDIASAIRYAADHGAEVINMSLGTSSYSYTLDEAVTYAYNKGLTVVAVRQRRPPASPTPPPATVGHRGGGRCSR